MTSFVDDNGNYLEYGGNDFLLTKQAASIYDFEIKGDVSVNFELPNTSPNRKALGYYGITQVGNPAYSVTPWNVIRNGVFIMRGTLAIYDEQNDAKKSVLHCFFFSGNANWIKSFDFNINEIETEKYTVACTETAINTQSSATSGIIFPIVDYCYGYKKGNEYFNFAPLLGGAGRTNSISYEDYFSEVMPCLYVNTIIKELARVSNIKFTGNLFDQPLYKKLILTHDGADVLNTDSFISKRSASLSVALQGIGTTGVSTKINYGTVAGTVVSEGTNKPFTPNTRWTCDANGAIDLAIYIETSVSQVYTVAVKKNGVTTLVSRAVTATNISLSLCASVVVGDYVEVYISNASAIFTILTGTLSIGPSKKAITNGGYLEDGGTYTGYYRFSSVAPAMKAIDFIKWLSVTFGAIITYDPSAAKLTFTCLDSITDTEDWTQYFKGNTFFYSKVTTNNYIRLPEAQEPDLIKYNASTTLKYGELNIKSQSKLNASTDVYDSPFGAVKDALWITKPQAITSYIQNVELTDGEVYRYTSITNAGGVAQFNGTTFPFNLLDGDVVVRIQDDNGYYNGYYSIDDTSALPTSLLFQLKGESFVSNSTGNVYVQNVNKKNPGVRALICQPSTNTIDFSAKSTFTMDGTSRASVAYAFYSKPVTNKDINNLKGSLAFGAVTIPGYVSPALGSEYFSKIRKFFSNRYGKVNMILPESVYQNYNFGKFVYNSELDRYFWISSIEAYKDSKTECLVYLLMI